MSGLAAEAPDAPDGEGPTAHLAKPYSVEGFLKAVAALVRN